MGSGATVDESDEYVFQLILCKVVLLMQEI